MKNDEEAYESCNASNLKNLNADLEVADGTQAGIIDLDDDTETTALVIDDKEEKMTYKKKWMNKSSVM